jgi:hypothetical protein
MSLRAEFAACAALATASFLPASGFGPDFKLNFR